MTMPGITPQEAASHLKQGAILVDVREADEFAREHIPGARNLPLSSMEAAEPICAEAVIFHCRSGARTLSNAEKLKAAADCTAFVLEGGLEGWKKAGLPVARDRRQPIEIMRQVQIAAGSLVVLGVALGVLLHPGFHALAGFVGAGLIFAGVTGTCGMARLLSLAPWNRRAKAG